MKTKDIEFGKVYAIGPSGASAFRMYSAVVLQGGWEAVEVGFVRYSTKDIVIDGVTHTLPGSFSRDGKHVLVKVTGGNGYREGTYKVVPLSHVRGEWAEWKAKDEAAHKADVERKLAYDQERAQRAQDVADYAEHLFALVPDSERPLCVQSHQLDLIRQHPLSMDVSKVYDMNRAVTAVLAHQNDGVA